MRREAQRREVHGRAAQNGRAARRGRSRELIVDAARASFIERGYVGTTIEAVAERAGVAVQTVYYVFGTKHSVLAAVLDASIAGDHDDVPLAGRDWMTELHGIDDGDAAFTQVVDASVGILARAAPVYDVVCRASSDPDVERLYRDTRRHRRADQRTMVEALHRNGHLRVGLDVDTAADTFSAIVNEETYLLLTVDAGWERERFRDWLDDALRRLLAADPPGAERS